MAKQTSNKLLYILAGVVAVLIVIAVIGKKQGWIGKDQLTEVTIAKADTGPIVEKVSASGKVQPEVEVKLSPEVSGEITELLVKEGDSVVKGQLLVKIRPDTYESNVERMAASVNNARAGLAQAKARLAQARANFTQTKLAHDRNKTLFADKVISQSELETSQANYDVSVQEREAAEQGVKAAEYNIQSAQASLKEARENLLKTTIYAPVSGTVSKLSVEQGERVVGTLQMAGTELMRIANLNNMEVRVNVNENDIIRLSLGDSVIIDVDSYSGRDEKFAGRVTSIANTAKDAQTLEAVTEFEVRIRILNESYKHLLGKGKVVSPFRPGMTASVEIITERKNNALRVPLAAVTTRTEEQLKETADKEGEKKKESDEKSSVKSSSSSEIKEVVFINNGGKAKAVEVKTGISDMDFIEIISGINKGDEVITGPFRAVSKLLKNETAIEVKDEKSLNKKIIASDEDED